ncbi:LLM class flavin-dependent oxidoreductase [Arthrobacter sp. H-02-3]|uniref:LLM class flavin-dependent oxidoreductase n=1 Tax=Arthrobacter sp. H-02-3 TaxID=2703675 RepID=UPI000DD1E4D0|nr:LLM class flavin-dependent oxidoreductase [Arthrobacter sp. H-02-3]PVZ53863.1 hypothetical protein C9424_16750 [Arthrobacter sp. H-02-3]
MTTAPQLIVEFPGVEVSDPEAARTVLSAARDAAAVTAARSVPLLLPETVDGGGPGLDPSILAGILTADLRGPHIAGTVARPADARPWLIATASTSRNAPFNLARRIQSLNRITGGQVGLFLRADGLDPVTSGASAGLAAAVGDRSRLLKEYVAVLRRLWVSFPEEALIGDREAGRFADPRSLVPASFAGEFYSVAGALNVPLPSAHRTLLLADAVTAALGGPVDGIIGPDSTTPDSGAVPVYRTVTWIPAASRSQALDALERQHGSLPRSVINGGVPAATGESGVVVAGTADDAAQVLRDGLPAHSFLRVRTGAVHFTALLDALLDELPELHESRDQQAHAR